jgi:hypothetical protein
MEYTGQLTVDDAVRGFRLHRRRQPGWRWWLLAPGLLLLAGLAELESRHFGLALAPAVLIVVVLAMTLVQVIVPWQLRGRSPSRPLYLPFHTRIDEKGFETRTELDQQQRRWADFKRWCEDGHYFVLVESESTVRVIPKLLLGNAERIAELRELLQRHLGATA